MKNKIISSLILAFLVVSIGFVSCEKDNTYLEDLKNQEFADRDTFLVQNNITTSPTASGLYFIQKEEEIGTGVQAKAGDVVKVNYQGQSLGGVVFDSSWDPAFGHETPYEFTLGTGSVIKGWDEAIALMKEGGTAKLIIPSDLAYGATGNSSIPPYSTLVFYVELVDVE